MEENELALFSSFLQEARSYVEFGCGGSTLHAASLGVPGIVSVDSSAHWLQQVAGKCVEAKLATKPTLVFADIGPTGDWGYPVDESCRDRWPNYAASIEGMAGTEYADLYLVDGRFRVSCFLKTLQRCKPDAVILFHDFASRREYHIVRQFAREIAVASDLSAFVPLPIHDRQAFADVLEQVKYLPG